MSHMLSWMLLCCWGFLPWCLEHSCLHLLLESLPCCLAYSYAVKISPILSWILFVLPRSLPCCLGHFSVVGNSPCFLGPSLSCFVSHVYFGILVCWNLCCTVLDSPRLLWSLQCCLEPICSTLVWYVAILAMFFHCFDLFPVAGDFAVLLWTLQCCCGNCSIVVAFLTMSPQLSFNLNLQWWIFLLFVLVAWAVTSNIYIFDLGLLKMQWIYGCFAFWIISNSVILRY